MQQHGGLALVGLLFCGMPVKLGSNHLCRHRVEVSLCCRPAKQVERAYGSHHSESWFQRNTGVIVATPERAQML